MGQKRLARPAGDQPVTGDKVRSGPRGGRPDYEIGRHSRSAEAFCVRLMESRLGITTLLRARARQDPKV